MDLADRIATLRRANGLSARQLAAMVDVAPTTVNRIESGSVSPSFALARELLAVLGEPLALTEATDRDAIAAARLAMEPSLPISRSPAVDRWLDRWARIGLVDAEGRAERGQEGNLLFRAATVARLARRDGATDFLPTSTWQDVASSLDAAAVEWALTGDAAANLYVSSAAESWPVFYVSDVDQAAQSSGLDARSAGTYGARITLIPFDGICEVGRARLDDVCVADRAQVVLDCFGGTGRMAEQADALISRAVV